MMATNDSNDGGRYIVPALRRGLEILEAFDADHSVMSLSDLSRAASLPPSTAYRLVRTLESMGYLQAVAGTKSYRLGQRVLKLGFRYLNTNEAVEAARPHLERLRDMTETSTHLGILDGVEVLYLCRVPSRGTVISNIQVGSRVPAHATAMGRVLLSWLEPGGFEALFNNRTLLAHTENTITSFSELRRTLAEDRARGYVITRSSFQSGVFAVAAPVRNVQGVVVAAINASGLASQFKDNQIDGTIRDLVIETAESISESLGYLPRRHMAV